MYSMQKRPRIRIVERSLQQVVGQGLWSAEVSLFDYCNIAKTRLERLSRVVDVLEESLTSTEALVELKNKPMAIRFDYYNAFTKIIMNLTGYMERVHFIAADQVKFELIKNKIKELTSPERKKDLEVKVVEGKEVVNGLLNLIQDEMSRRDNRGI